MLTLFSQNQNNLLLKAVKDFQEDPINYNRKEDSGLAILGVTRQELSEKLLTLKENKSCRELLAKEIFEAFSMYFDSKSVNGKLTPTDRKFRKLYVKLQKIQGDLHKTHQEIVKIEDFADYQDSRVIHLLPTQETDPEIIQLTRKYDIKFQQSLAAERFGQWLSANKLKNDKFEESGKKLRNKINNLKRIEKQIVAYCAKLKNFTYYVTALKEEKIRLGSQSVLLYARAVEKSLYIWKNTENSTNNLTSVDYYEAVDSDEHIDMLLVDGLSEFKKLVPNRVEYNVVEITTGAEVGLESESVAEEPAATVVDNLEIELNAVANSDELIVREWQKLIENKKDLISHNVYQELRYLIILINRYLSLKAREVPLTNIDSLREYLNESEIKLGNEGNKNLIIDIKKSQKILIEHYYRDSSNDECLNHLKKDIIDASIHHYTKLKIDRLYEFLSMTINKIINEKTDHAASIISVYLTWIDSLPLLMREEQVKDSCHLLLDQMSKVKIENINNYKEQLIDKLLASSPFHLNKYIALEELLNIKEINKIIQQSSWLDQHFISTFNSEGIQLQDPYKQLKMLIKTLEKTIGDNSHRLTAILEKLEFGLSHEQACVFYEVFITENANSLSARAFLDSLIHSFNIGKFYDERVTNGSESRTIQYIGYMLSYTKYGNNLLQEMINFEKKHFSQHKFPIYTLLTPAFLYLSQWKPDITDPFIWYRILYHLGRNINIKEQYEICHTVKANIEKNQEPELLAFLSNSLENIHRYYYDNKKHDKSFIAIYEIVTNKLVDAARSIHGKSMMSVVEILQTIVNHCLGVNKDHLYCIFDFTNKKLGNYTNGLEAVKEIFNDALRGDDPSNWITQNLAERIFFIYCYAKYPPAEYHKNFLLANQQYADYITHKIPQSVEGVTSLQQALPGYEYLPELGFKIIQNSQLAAIKCVIDPPSGAKYVFEKIGTGQGKSLIIALSAISYALKYPDKKIYIFTVYDHLAKRDYQRFKLLFDKYGIKSTVVKDKSHSISSEYQIIYSELNTYMQAMYNQTIQKIKNIAIANEEHDFSQPGFVFLDEFDSIVLDVNNFGNTVYDHQEFFSLGKPSRNDLEPAEKFKQLLSQNSEMGDFLDALQANDLSCWIDNWLSSAHWGKGYTGQNNLGIENNYIGGELWELTQGKFYTTVRYFKVLVFLKNSLKVFGFSGSIDHVAIKRFDQLFSDCAYFDVVPFFGLNKSKNYERFNNIGNPLTDNGWLAQIKASIESAIQRKQPILIFSDNEKTNDWNAVKNIVESLAQEHQRVMYVIGSKTVIDDTLLANVTKSNSVTIASPIMARGVDLIAQPEINNYGGLHIIITYFPTKDGKQDRRVLIQMIGRTSRMENEGSHEIIIKNQLPDPEPNHPIVINNEEESYYHLINAIYKKVCELPYNKNLWRSWLLLNTFIKKSSEYPLVLKEKGAVDQQVQFIVNEIINPAPRQEDNPQAAAPPPLRVRKCAIL